MRTKKIILLLLLAGIAGVIVFFACRYTYESKMAELRFRALNSFAEALNSELISRNLHGNILHNFNCSSIASDSLETVYWVDKSGRHEYRIDPANFSLNIEQDPNVRILHSIAFMKEPLHPDSLNVKWLEQTNLSNLNFKSAIRISLINEDGSIKSQKITSDNEWCDLSNLIFYRYIGYACETRVDCYLYISLWNIMYKEILLFLVLYIILVLGVYKFFIFLKFKLNSLRRKEVVEVIKEVPVEIPVEVHIYEEVQKVDVTSIHSYKLAEGIIFCADRNIIIFNGVEEKIQAQSCLLLEMFLKSNQDYILKDDEIMENLWPDGSGNNVRMHKAVGRLRLLINNIVPSFDIIKKVGTYQLIISDNSPIN